MVVDKETLLSLPPILQGTRFELLFQSEHLPSQGSPSSAPFGVLPSPPVVYIFEVTSATVAHRNS